MGNLASNLHEHDIRTQEIEEALAALRAGVGGGGGDAGPTTTTATTTSTSTNTNFDEGSRTNLNTNVDEGSTPIAGAAAAAAAAAATVTTTNTSAGSGVTMRSSGVETPAATREQTLTNNSSASLSNNNTGETNEDGIAAETGQPRHGQPNGQRRHRNTASAVDDAADSRESQPRRRRNADSTQDTTFSSSGRRIKKPRTIYPSPDQDPSTEESTGNHSDPCYALTQFMGGLMDVFVSPLVARAAMFTFHGSIVSWLSEKPPNLLLKPRELDDWDPCVSLPDKCFPPRGNIRFEDMEEEDELVYSYPCTCNICPLYGYKDENAVYRVTLQDLWRGNDVVKCPSCGYSVVIDYNRNDLPELPEGEEVKMELKKSVKPLAGVGVKGGTGCSYDVNWRGYSYCKFVFFASVFLEWAKIEGEKEGTSAIFKSGAYGELKTMYKDICREIHRRGSIPSSATFLLSRWTAIICFLDDFSGDNVRRKFGSKHLKANHPCLNSRCFQLFHPRPGNRTLNESDKFYQNSVDTVKTDQQLKVHETKWQRRLNSHLRKLVGPSAPPDVSKDICTFIQESNQKSGPVSFFPRRVSDPPSLDDEAQTILVDDIVHRVFVEQSSLHYCREPWNEVERLDEEAGELPKQKFCFFPCPRCKKFGATQQEIDSCPATTTRYHVGYGEYCKWFTPLGKRRMKKIQPKRIVEGFAPFSLNTLGWTPRDYWMEYNNGIDGKTPLRQLEDEHGSAWRSQKIYFANEKGEKYGRDMIPRTWAGMKRLFQYIDTCMGHLNKTEDEALHQAQVIFDSCLPTATLKGKAYSQANLLFNAARVFEFETNRIVGIVEGPSAYSIHYH